MLVQQKCVGILNKVPVIIGLHGIFGLPERAFGLGTFNLNKVIFFLVGIYSFTGFISINQSSLFP